MHIIRIINKSCIFFSLLISHACLQAANDTWGVVRQQFSINHQLNEPEVQSQIQWLISHPKYFNQLSQAEPFIYHIISEIQKRKMPGELALIPMIESSYNPFAYSGAGAAGLWQLMPDTGKYLGIKDNWWIDERRSISHSTTAALNYFSHLNQLFKGDWLLAIAAYDCGEGKIKRLLHQKNSYEQSFWYLDLPQETQLYVPRLLALAEIIAHPERYHITLPYVPHQPYFTEVKINGQIDLNKAAQLAGIPYKDLLTLNPGFNHWATSPSPQKLLIPVKKAREFYENLTKTPIHLRASFLNYLIKPGDTLSSISSHFHTQTQLLAQINHLKSDQLTPGFLLKIPNISQAQQNILKRPPLPIQPQHYKILHIVQTRDTIESIAKKYAINREQILTWNSLQQPHLNVGQKIIIWKNT